MIVAVLLLAQLIISSNQNQFFLGVPPQEMIVVWQVGEESLVPSVCVCVCMMCMMCVYVLVGRVSRGYMSHLDFWIRLDEEKEGIEFDGLEYFILHQPFRGKNPFVHLNILIANQMTHLDR